MDFGREITGSLAVAESREWLCANGLGGFASGTVAGLPTRRYHGLLVAALKPPVGRTVLVDRARRARRVRRRDVRAVDRTAGRTARVAPDGYRLIERFHLDGTTPVWHYACADALVEKRVWMEPGANTTYVRYRLLRAGAGGPVRLTLRALVNYREFHATTHGPGWQMAVAPAGHGSAGHRLRRRAAVVDPGAGRDGRAGARLVRGLPAGRRGGARPRRPRRQPPRRDVHGHARAGPAAHRGAVRRGRVRTSTASRRGRDGARTRPRSCSRGARRSRPPGSPPPGSSGSCSPPTSSW